MVAAVRGRRSAGEGGVWRKERRRGRREGEEGEEIDVGGATAREDKSWQG